MKLPSRRVLGATLLTLVGAACGDSTSPDGGDDITLTVVSWGGAYQSAMTDAWFVPYGQANPRITLTQDSPTDYQTIQTMVQSGTVTWDVVDVENDFGLQGTQSLLEPIDCDRVPCDELQPERYRTTGYRVPVMLWGLVMAYRTDAWNGTQPQAWNDFFDLAGFPGSRTVRRTGAGSGILEAALLADGVDPAALYPLDIERALAKLETIADEIVWWDDGQECPQLLADDVAVMGLCYNGRVFDFQQQGHPIAIQWNGAIIQADYLVVPKGSSHVDEAMDLIAYITSAEHNAELSDFISYAPANVQAVSRVNPAMEPHLPSTYADVTVARDDIWLDEHRDEIRSRFDEWLAQHGG